MSQIDDLSGFYEIMERLNRGVGGFRYLDIASQSSGWPERGVYFFFDDREPRGNGSGPRVVRVGTHAVACGVQSTLWSRLSQHRGSTGGAHPGGGNHRGSVFRMHVGNALLARGEYGRAVSATWPQRGKVPSQVRESEHRLECDVSAYIRRLPLLWLDVPDESSAQSHRRVIEVSAIGLLSSQSTVAADPASNGWLGRWAVPEEIRASGLWNIDAVGGGWDPNFLNLLEHYAARTPSGSGRGLWPGRGLVNAVDRAGSATANPRDPALVSGVSGCGLRAAARVRASSRPLEPRKSPEPNARNTLHEAIKQVLTALGRAATAREILDYVQSHELYERRDSTDVTVSQIDARIRRYPQLFSIDRSTRPFLYDLVGRVP